MRRLVLPLVCALVACGGSGQSDVEGELAAATFVVEFPASEAVSSAKDRLANTSEIENRLDVIRPSTPSTEAVFDTDPPVPFEFVRDPLNSGSLPAFVQGAERVIAILHPLINPTPNGRVLSGRLVAFDASGVVLRTDFDDDGDARVDALVEWGAGIGVSALEALALAADGLNDRGDDLAAAAAAVLRG